MRPDQHKQKQHAQYKRKHGIAKKETNQSADEKNDQKKSSFATSGRQKQDKKSSGAGTRGKEDVKSNRNRDPPSSDSDDDVRLSTDPQYENKTFRRREIVSNWSRYTLPEESENQQQAKGEDFTIVLNTAGSAQAQFRFKDEQDWESDVPCLIDTSNILSLDCDKLATAIQCIPVHERLGLETDLFSKGQVDEFIQEADQFQKLYKDLSTTDSENCTSEKVTSLPTKKPKRETVSAINSSSKPTTNSDRSDGDNIVLTASLKKLTVNKEDTSGIQLDSDNIIKDIKTLHTDKEKVSEKEVDTKLLNRSVEKVKPSKTESVDDELDFLLSMETPQSVGSAAVASNGKSSESEKEKQLLPEAKKEEALPTSSPKPQQAQPSSKCADKEESLEDWLDSMLDD